MIHFVNINNGRVYNGDMPYVHWFDGQQSTDLVYVQKLCVITTDFNLHVHLPENDVFHLLNVESILQPDENPTILDQITYKDIQAMYCNDLDLSGARYEHSGYYVYMIYIAGSSNIAIEAKESIFIGDNEYTIGADFYDEREELKINVGNQGLDLPESVQRAIYPSNVHEEAKDNILLNRKYKELLMDYMSILGDRGSYSSLINSLNWFEYGDLLRMKEFWKHYEGDRVEFNNQPLSQVLQDAAKSMLAEYTKTTYIGIYCACQNMKRTLVGPGAGSVEYEAESISQYVEDSNFKWAQLSSSLPNNDDDSGRIDKLFQVGLTSVNVDDPIPGTNEDKEGSNWLRATKSYSEVDRFIGEGVPVLEQAAFMWSRLDMSIKMALLGNFYESYFMPVHLDLIHSTIEDVVFTNTIKVTNHGHMDRVDHITNVHAIHCNIKNGQEFMLGDVEVNATIHTPFVNTSHRCDGVFVDSAYTLTEQEYDEQHCPEPGQGEAKCRLGNPSILLINWNDGAHPYTQGVVAHLGDYLYVCTGVTDDDVVMLNLLTIDNTLVGQEEMHVYVGQLFQPIKGTILNIDRYSYLCTEVPGPDKTLGFAIYKKTQSQYDTYQITGTHDVLAHGYLNLDLLTDEQGNVIAIDSRSASYNPALAVQYNEQFHTFYLNNYSGTGVIVPFVFDIDLEDGDFISRMMLGYFNPNIGEWELLESVANKEILSIDQETHKATIKFELLCTQAKEYDLRFQFTSAGSRVYVKRIRINVVDDYSATIEVYKVKRSIPKFTIDRPDGSFDINEKFNEYLFSHVLHTDYDKMDDAHKYYKQYIPVDTKSSTDASVGVGLNRVIIFRKEVLSLMENFILKTPGQNPNAIVTAMKNAGLILNMPDSEAVEHVSILRDNMLQLMEDPSVGIPRYLRSYKYNWNPNTQQWDASHNTLTIVDTYFNGIDSYGEDRNKELNYAMEYIKDSLYELSKYAGLASYKYDWERVCLRDEMIYIPHFHKMVPLFQSEVDENGYNTRPTLEQLTVYPNECLCVVPDLKFTKHFSNGRSVEIKWTEWIFRNASNGIEYRLPSIREPYIAPDDGKYERLPKGYYDIIFRYKLDEDSEIREITKESAFIQK